MKKLWLFIAKRQALLIGIVVLAFVLRVYKVVEVPPALNWDEVSIGYNAYSVLKTGKDEWGQFLPLHFRSYGEYKLPAQIYASIPGIAIFGLNDFGVRITPVIYGTITVLMLYFLTKALFQNKSLALIAAFLLAISPWHLHLTRASFESSFSVLWVILGIWFLLKGFKNSRWWIASAIPFGIAVYTYNSARVFVPLFLLAAFLIHKKEIFRQKKNFLLAGIVFMAFLVPLIPFSLKGEVSARYKLVSISTEPGLVPRINERRGLSQLPGPLPRLVHNKVTYITYYFVNNYLAHFMPDFLFISGASHKQHHVQGVGQLYLIQAPFVLTGVYFLFKKKEKYRWLITAWILLAFVPVATTRDSIPHALRTVIAAPAYQILTAYGFWATTALTKKRKLKIAFWGLTTIILAFSFTGYLDNYYNKYPQLYSRDWQYGYKEAVSFVKEHYQEYDQIVFSRNYGEPHMFTLFYLNWDPSHYQNDPNLVRFQSHDWVWVTNFDKFYFPDLGDAGTQYSDIVRENPGKKLLFVGRPGDFPENLKKLKEVNFLNGDVAFEIVEKI